MQRLKQWTVDRRPTHSAPSSSLTSPNASTVHLVSMTAVNVSSTADNVSASGLQPLTTNQRKRIKTYLKRCRLHPKHSQLNLESYLLLPIQRIPRYRMLVSLSNTTTCQNLIAFFSWRNWYALRPQIPLHMTILWIVR